MKIGLTAYDVHAREFLALAAAADNKLGLNSGWDRHVLASELVALGDVQADLSLTAFGEDFCRTCLPAPPPRDEPPSPAVG